MTNFEYFKSLSAEELAQWLVQMNPKEMAYMAPNGEVFRNVYEAIDETEKWLNEEFKGD